MYLILVPIMIMIKITLNTVIELLDKIKLSNS